MTVTTTATRIAALRTIVEAFTDQDNANDGQLELAIRAEEELRRLEAVVAEEAVAAERIAREATMTAKAKEAAARKSESEKAEARKARFLQDIGSKARAALARWRASVATGNDGATVAAYCAFKEEAPAWARFPAELIAANKAAFARHDARMAARSAKKRDSRRD